MKSRCNWAWVPPVTMYARPRARTPANWQTFCSHCRYDSFRHSEPGSPRLDDSARGVIGGEHLTSLVRRLSPPLPPWCAFSNGTALLADVPRATQVPGAHLCE